MAGTSSVSQCKTQATARAGQGPRAQAPSPGGRGSPGVRLRVRRSPTPSPAPGPRSRARLPAGTASACTAALARRWRTATGDARAAPVSDPHKQCSRRCHYCERAPRSPTGASLSLALSPLPARLLPAWLCSPSSARTTSGQISWHLIFDPGLDCGLKTMSTG